MEHKKLFIAGKDVPPKSEIFSDILNPATGETTAEEPPPVLQTTQADDGAVPEYDLLELES
ncbi:hypothetical protein IIA29_11455, partial [candidate division KSB1 bacterium]|nr:hypothetical protein [candidate division KSB1 bacterium]